MYGQYSRLVSNQEWVIVAYVQFIVLVISIFFSNSRPSALNFKSCFQSLEHFFLTVGQKNFGDKIPFLGPLFLALLIFVIFILICNPQCTVQLLLFTSGSTWVSKPLIDMAAAVVRKITKFLSLAFLCAGNAWLKATSAYFSFKLQVRSYSRKLQRAGLAFSCLQF